MPIFDFECQECKRIERELVPSGVQEIHCSECGYLMTIVWLQPPKLDWSGMAQGPNAGPEFIDRFERSHQERKAKEEAHHAEHGDNLRGAGG